MGDSSPDVDPAAPTELAGIADAHTESAYAWGLEDPVPESLGWWTSRRVTGAALVGCLVVMGGAGVVAVHTLHRPVAASSSSPAATPSSTPTPPSVAVGRWGVPAPSTTAVPMPAPPVTVTVTPPTTVRTVAVPTPTVPSPAQVAVYDQQFLARMRADNWTITDPVVMAQKAHLVCGLLQQGASPEFVENKFVSESGFPMSSAVSFTSNAMLTYPNCP